jgi:hypothetical protein
MEYADDDICLRPSSLAVREPTRSVPGLGEFAATIDSNSLRPEDTTDEVDEDDDDVEEPSPNPCSPSFVPEVLRLQPSEIPKYCATVLTTSAKR